MKMTEDHAEHLQELMRWRRDMRHFRRTPLSEDLIEELRAAMDLAPSVGNARPWRVFRVEEPGLRQQVRADFLRCNQAAAESYDNDTRVEYTRLKLAGIDKAPLQLAVFTETDPPEGRGLGRATMPHTLEQSTSMAVYGMWLTARAHNLGIGMLSILDPDRMKTLFDVPESWNFTAYLCIGYPEFDDDTPLLHRKGWQENAKTEWVTR
ncbi:MAG: 5,6-dimethylbenzimidazole synthase [Pelagimonas sp.]|jgi:5,6-dimethylbenzimidazole synthase|nr:5,6-dimethylbenzimidazole synthase [Pelagimonas sp.]